MCLFDITCDQRRQRLHKIFRIGQSPGITGVVLDPSTLPSAAWPIPSLADSFVAVPAGALPPHPSSFINTPGFAQAAIDSAESPRFMTKRNELSTC